MDSCFDYSAQHGGLCSEADYPYTAKDGTCHGGCGRYSAMTGKVYVTRQNEAALEAAVAINPVSVSIQADKAFGSYKSGILSADCGTSVNHGVLIVGYGVENGVKYWKVKNSWGANWGDHGYIRIARYVQDPKGLCGILQYPIYPKAHKI